MKIIHAADLHLDSPLHGLERYEGAPLDALRSATRRALENLVALAIREQVALILIAGDLFDGDLRDYNAGLFFHRQLSKLREAGIKVVWLSGNHDAASEITKTLKAVEQLPNVHRLSETAPQTIRLNLHGLDVAIHGQGFTNKSVKDNLAANYPTAVRGMFNIGLLHTSLDGKPGHDSYAPCKLDDLHSKNYQYFALGHVHKQEIVSREPWVAFAGNIQGRHIKEAGVKGCLLLTLDNQQIITVEPVALDVLRWRGCEIDVTGAEDAEAVLDKVKLGLIANNSTWERPEAIRLTIVGECKASADLNRRFEHWINELRAQAADISNGSIWLEKILLHTQDHITYRNLEIRDDGLGSLLKAIQTLNPNDPIVERLEKESNMLAARLPIELKSENWLRIKQPDILANLREDLLRMMVSNIG